MTDINAWLDTFVQRLSDKFAERVWFVGLQGSYGRGEATETSDIDVVAIFDKLSASDIRQYNELLNEMPHRELICGFISGREELLKWDTAELFQFVNDTKPIKGSLDVLLQLIDDTSVDKAIKTAVCGIYHGCVHNMLHEKSDDILKELYKAASFAVQAICYRQSGEYISRQSDLLKCVSEDEQNVVEIFLHLKNGGAADFYPMSETLFEWSKSWIVKI